MLQVRSDQDLDLALLQADVTREAHALSLGRDERFGALINVVAFGIPLASSRP